MIKLYGIANGYGSRAQVTSGFRLAIEKNDIPMEFCAIDQDDGSFERLGDGEPIAIMTGPLEASGVIAQTHARRFALIAPNGTAIPNNMKSCLKQVYTDIIVPSQWAVQAVSDVGLPVHVVPHGVFSNEIKQAVVDRSELREDYERYGVFSVVHFSSSHGERKGTVELVKAWQELRSEDDHWKSSSVLVLVLDHLAQVRFEQDYDGDMTGITITPRLDGTFRGSGQSPKDIAQGYKRFHAVIQPSRGEGFGLIPLEALAAGVPVIMTDGSGHSEYANRPEAAGAVKIISGRPEPIDDCEGSMAPSVSVASIKWGLGHMRDNWLAYEKLAAEYSATVRFKWNWPVKVGPFLQEIIRGLT